MSVLITPYSLSNTITPEEFNNIWNLGNKFRLLRHQSTVINPNNPNFKQSGLSISYYETSNTFEVQENTGLLDAKIASFKGDYYGKYAFIDIGSMDIRELQTSKNSNLNHSQYTRIMSGVRYNELPNVGITAGILITTIPLLNSQDQFIFGEQDDTIDTFIAASAFGFQLMASTVKDEDIYVETSSYDNTFFDIGLSLQRSKIHNISNNAKKYKTEYVADFYIDGNCSPFLWNIQPTCNFGLKRRETYNDNSQGWSLYVTRPLYSIVLNTFDEETNLRNKRYGYSFEVGINSLPKAKQDNPEKKSINLSKLTFGVHMNNGANQLFEVQDDLMIGFNFRMEFL
ncbi:hypothetical protein [Oceaniserpentilla sp. 4NH20-0058]|uniref:hypothetical protein n=1 Tax=Oceaniserpentilla sp. 4NH20-0058 TaxID=3127660 RepID=UPI0033423170